MKLYHGTSVAFDAFDLRYAGTNYRESRFCGLYATEHLHVGQRWAGSRFDANPQLVLAFELADAEVLQGQRMIADVCGLAKVPEIYDSIMSEYGALDGKKFYSQFLPLKSLGEAPILAWSTTRKSLYGGVRTLLNMMEGKIPLSGKYTGLDAAGVICKELGFAALSDKHEEETVIYNLSKISEATLASASRSYLQEHGLKIGQVVIGAGNKPLPKAAARPQAAPAKALASKLEI